MFAMHTRYIKRTRNKPAGNKRSKCQNVLFAMETQAIYTEIARNLFRFLIRKAMFQKVTKWHVCYAHQKVTKWHVCYAHMIHQANVKQTNKKQTIYIQGRFVLAFYV